ncbi:hypothetical protein H310_12820 [Aphanomyces invadans]|uniref:ABC transmembrane type-1 domain-containing protein n=1 Tax=Aphanomyces invadans TaxID=157072 RepID=A0A024TGT9_9STRA|nr:hypothetical protein H310_12820 [Aphanomyces invadans]ETV93224.1 hypothetical protein H310_12820 [Aphanomyces invadans]|eukprot:XP_008878246.1 hypothetical protein H310_12820 [Aphanomyces invadans]
MLVLPGLTKCNAQPDDKSIGQHFVALASPLGDNPSITDNAAWRDLPNPMDTANWFRVATMLWFDSLIHRGAKRTMQENDVWKLCPRDTAAHLHAKFHVHWQQELNGHADRPKFGRAMWKTLKLTTLWATTLHGLYAVLMLVQPTMVKLLLEYLQTPRDQLSPGVSMGYFLAALLSVLSVVAITLADFGQYLNTTLGVNAKSIVMDSVYHKTLKLSRCSNAKMTSGEIVTMAAVDSERLFQGYMVVPWLVVAPATLIAVFILVGIEMGFVVGLVGGLSIAAVLYWGLVSAKAVGQARHHITTIQAERVKLTNEILHGIRVVKLYAWETYMEERIKTIRAKELALLRSYQYQRVLNTVVLSIAPVFSLALCLALYIAQGNELTTPLAFTIIAYVNH